MESPLAASDAWIWSTLEVLNIIYLAVGLIKEFRVSKSALIENSGPGGGCLFVFGLVFFLAGMIPGYLAFSSLWQWYQASDWMPVAATIHSAHLSSSTSDGSTTYNVTGSFNYQFEQRDYSSERIHFGAGSDNIGSFHQDTYALLRRHRDSGEPITARVNPASPSEAVLIPDMRWGLFAFMMLFPLLFGGVGAVIMGASMVGANRSKDHSRRQQQHPEEPWRWRPEWATGEIHCQSKNAMWFAIAFALVWNLISAPLAFMLPEEVLDQGNYAAALGLVFPLVGLGLAIWAVRAVIRWRKFGRTSLHMHQLPAPLGGHLQAEMRCPRAIDARQIRFTLSCINKHSSGGGKNHSSKEKVLWQDETTVSLASGSRYMGAIVPVSFRLPAAGRASDDSNSSDEILWRLEARAEVPGVDFAARFTIPVFDTGEDFARVAEQATSSADRAGDWKRTGVVVSLTPMGTRYYFPAARQPMMAGSVTLFGLIFSGATVFLLLEEAWVMTTGFGLVSLLLDYAALALWFKRHELLANRIRLRVRSGLMTLGQGREYDTRSLNAIEISTGAQLGNKQFWDLQATRDSATPIPLASNLAARGDSEALARHLAQSLGIGPPLSK